MSQIEVTKVVPYAMLGVTAGNISASKVVAYARLRPGDSGVDDSNRQGHVYAQKIRRG
jgi:hypothetical protein